MTAYAVDPVNEPAVVLVVEVPALAAAELGFAAERRGVELCDLVSVLLVAVAARVRPGGGARKPESVARAERRYRAKLLAGDPKPAQGASLRSEGPLRAD